MRILHVVASSLRRGAEVFAADLIRALDRDVDHHVALLRSDRTELTYPAVTTVLGSGLPFPGVRVDLRAIRDLRLLIAEVGPSTVQVHGGEPLKHALLASAGSEVPVVYRRIGPAPRGIVRGPRRVAHARLMRRAERIVAVANVLRDEAIMTFGVRPERIETIPNAVDPSRLQTTRGPAAVRSELGIDSRSPVALSVGALTPEKDPLAHLRVVRIARREVPSLVHVVVGDGPVRADLEREATRNGHLGRIVIAGSRSDVGDLLAASDVVLLASRSEGLPACVIEAGMLGVPTVGFAVGGVSEAVDDGVTGRLVPPLDEERLGYELARLLLDDAERRSMGAAARAHCERRFHIRDAARRYLRLYEALAR